MKASNAQLVFYKGNKPSALIQGSEHITIMHGNQVLLAEKTPAAENATAQTRFLSTEGIGSTIASLLNNQHYDQSFDPYGNIDPFQIKTRLGFTGQLRQTLTGSYLLGSRRALNPATMRFNSYDDRSPFAEGGINGYAYCRCDPINYTDPFGRSPWRWFKKHVLGTTPKTDKYAAAFENGRQQGLSEGLSASQREFQQGFDAGRRIGYDEGHHAGLVSGHGRGVKQGYREGMVYGSAWGFAEGKISGSKRINRPLQTFVERAEHTLTEPLPLGDVTSEYFNVDQNELISTLANMRHQEAGLAPPYHRSIPGLPKYWNSQILMQYIRNTAHASPFNPGGR